MVKEEKVYITSDGKQYKTKKSANRYENELYMKNEGYSKKEVDELIPKLTEKNRVLKHLIGDKPDWRDLPLNIVKQLSTLIVDYKTDAVRYQIIKVSYWSKNEEVILREKMPRLPEGELPKKFTEYVDDLTKKDKDKNGSTYSLELHSKEGDVIKYVVKETTLTPEFKMSQGKRLNEGDISELLNEREEVYEVEGEDSRWSRSVTTVIKADDGELYAIDWEKGLTERQEHMYDNQPRKVKLETKEIVTTVTEIVDI